MRVSHQQSGVALIVVLLLLVFILSVVGGLFYRHQIHLQKVSHSLVREQAVLLGMSAEHWVGQLLTEDASANQIDSLNEKWARELPPMPVEGGTVSGCVMDMQARFNINHLSWYTNKSWEEEVSSESETETTTRKRWMQRLMAASGIDNSDLRVAALVDWMDADAWLTLPESAEDNEYLALSPARRAANQTMLELRELSLVRGFTTQDPLALSWAVTALPEMTRLNVNTASAAVLQSLSTLISDNVAAAMVKRRPFDSVAEFYRELSVVAGYTEERLRQAIPQEFVDVSSHYFQLHARVQLAGVNIKYRALYRRVSSSSAAVMWRSIESWPDFEQQNDEAQQSCQTLALWDI